MQAGKSTKRDTRPRVLRAMIALTGYIRRQYATVPNAPKLLADLAECSHRTTQKWLQGEHDPDLVSALNFARHDPEAQEILLRAMERK